MRQTPRRGGGSSAETGIFLGVGSRRRRLAAVRRLAIRHVLAHPPRPGRRLYSHASFREPRRFLGSSFTRAGQPGRGPAVAGRCGMAAVHRCGGLDGLLLATVTLLAGLTTCIAWRLLCD